MSQLQNQENSQGTLTKTKAKKSLLITFDNEQKSKILKDLKKYIYFANYSTVAKIFIFFKEIIQIYLYLMLQMAIKLA